MSAKCSWFCNKSHTLTKHFFVCVSRRKKNYNFKTFIIQTALVFRQYSLVFRYTTWPMVVKYVHTQFLFCLFVSKLCLFFYPKQRIGQRQQNVWNGNAKMEVLFAILLLGNCVRWEITFDQLLTDSLDIHCYELHIHHTDKYTLNRW